MSTAETEISAKNEELKDAILNLISGIQHNPDKTSAVFRAKSKPDLHGFESVEYKTIIETNETDKEKRKTPEHLLSAFSVVTTTFIRCQDRKGCKPDLMK